MRDARILYLQYVHLQSFQVLLELPEIGSIVQITEGFRGPMIPVRVRIDDEYIATGAHHAT